MNTIDTFKYFVMNNSSLVEVDSRSYENWHGVFGRDYSMPEFTLESNDIVYSLDSLFHGIVDKGEELLPFLLFYFEDNLVLNEDGVERIPNKDYVFFFTTFQELESAQSRIIDVLRA